MSLRLKDNPNIMVDNIKPIILEQSLKKMIGNQSERNQEDN